MKNKLSEVLTKHLREQRYTYLWEVKLFFTKGNENDIEAFKVFTDNENISQHMPAICLPQHEAYKKTETEIADFVQSLQRSTEQVCMVIANVSYNPAQPMAVYILDCPLGEEEKCTHEVVKQWSACPELYFMAVNINYIADKIIEFNPLAEKKKGFFKKIFS